jgi:hypothetical protein
MKDHRQHGNPRNVEFHDNSQRFLKKLLKMLPVKPQPLSISQQLEVTKLIEAQNTPVTGKPITLRKG